MATEIHVGTSGNTIQYTPGSAVVAGQVIPLDTIIGVAERPIASGELGSLVVAGRADGVACKSADVITQGEQLYWDDGNAELTVTATDNTYAGVAASAAADGVTTCSLLINAGSRTAVTS